MEPTYGPDRGDALDRVQAYQLAAAAVREEREEVMARLDHPATGPIEVQLLRALGSITANIAEGYSRGTAADRRRFFEYALGSVREAIAWYQAVPAPRIPARVDRLVSIRRLLLTMIRNARHHAQGSGSDFQR